MKLETNRDLYLAVSELIERHADKDLSLDVYLTNVLHLASKYSTSEALSLKQFYDVLSGGFDIAARNEGLLPKQNASWDSALDTDGYQGWYELISCQITDLKVMSAAGRLDDEYIYLGIPSSDGVCWYNFDPFTYLECATAGFFDGWSPDDDNGRKLTDPTEHYEAPFYEIAVVKWNDFKGFLWCGQIYE